MARIPIIPVMYFGPVELYRLLARHGRVIVDTGEHYERQTYRTRTRIIGPNGAQDLVVRTSRMHGTKMPMHSVGLSYAESWPQQHVHALRSAYGRTPWAIHFLDDLENGLTVHHARLIDLDLWLMRLSLKWLGLPDVLDVSSDHIEADPAIHVDLRHALHPKKSLPPEVEPVPSYPQVFADRHGFIARASIIDLLCNRGPQARIDLLK